MGDLINSLNYSLGGSFGVILGILFLLFVFGRGRVRRALPYLVLQDFRFNANEDELDGVVLELQARKPGIVAWIMSKMGIANKSFLRITNREVKVTVSGFFGTTHFVAPMTDLTSSYGSLIKPTWQLYLGVALAAISAFSLLTGSLLVITGYSYYGYERSYTGLIIALIIAALLLFSYWRSRQLVVAFSTTEIINWYGMAFKPASSGTANVSYETLLEAIQHINTRIVNAHIPSGE